jgi:hypothetical protein
MRYEFWDSSALVRMTMAVEWKARFTASSDGAALLFDRRARTFSTMAPVLGAKPWLGVYSA